MNSAEASQQQQVTPTRQHVTSTVADTRIHRRLLLLCAERYTSQLCLEYRAAIDFTLNSNSQMLRLNINLNNLLKFHRKNKKKITVTAVHPPARFGELSISNNLVTKFEEKPQLQDGWINGGFFVLEPEFLNFIGKKNVMLERSPLKRAVKSKNLAAYKHTGFWFAMDTLRDKKVLDNLIKNKKAPWLK